jgi:hypothetical protein
VQVVTAPRRDDDTDGDASGAMPTPTTATSMTTPKRHQRDDTGHIT